jgi:Xaa-Pro aminopeptidase
MDNFSDYSGAWDLTKLRNDRLAKLQKVMKARDVGALLLFSPVNVRYATGIAVMPLWTAVNLARYAVVFPDGEPVLYEYGKALFRAKEVWQDSQYARPWQFRFGQSRSQDLAKQFVTEVKQWMERRGVKGSRVAIDQCDFIGFRALCETSLEVCDADEIIEEAHTIKTADELALLRQSCSVAESALHALELAIVPGVTEHELLGTFWGKMLSLGGEHCSTRLLVSGPKTNPWFQEAGDRRVRPGDLVAIDTDMIGPEGYLCDISRTFLCGDQANADQLEAYRVAYDYIHQVMEMCVPGKSYTEIMERVPKIPEGYREQGYSCMIHGCGLDDEPPFLPFPGDDKVILPHGVLEENMVLSIEFYAGKIGKRDGVKLEEQVVLTKSGPQLLSGYPFEEKLLRKY